jgi:hypothetical protein
MKTATKITLLALLGITLLLFLNGFYYILIGQDKSIRKLNTGEELNPYEVQTIRSFNFLNYTIGRARCREAAEQCWLMQWAKADSVTSKQDFTKAHFIAAKIKNGTETPVTVDADSFDLYKTDGNYLFKTIWYGGQQSLYALAYHNATLCKEPGCEPKMKTTANIHYSYGDALLFAFPFSLIKPQLYSQMIEQGYFKNVVITYVLP